jgi:hypothetical protein
MLLIHKTQAIRNHGYTNEVRLFLRNATRTRTKKIITHEGGFCLCSREFHSPFI